MAGEHAQHPQQRMQTAAARITDDEHGRLRVRVRLDDLLHRPERLIGEDPVDGADGAFGFAVVVTDEDAQAGNGGDDERGGPAALREALDEQHGQDAGADHEADQRQQEAPHPAHIVRILAVAPPVQAQAEQRDRERQEHRDRIQHDEQRDLAARPEQDRQRGNAHHEDAVLRHEARGQIAELVGHPGIRRHVRQHRRPAEEARIGRHEQQPGLEGERDGEQHLVHQCAAEAHAGDDAAERGRVQRLARGRLRVPQEVQQDDAAGRDRQRQRHVEHRHLSRANARLGQQVDVVRHGLEAGIGTAALRIREQQHAGHAGPADLARERGRLGHRIWHQLRQVRRMRHDAVHDQHEVRGDEAEEDRQQDLDRLLQPAQIHHDQQADEKRFGPEFIRLEAERQERRERIDAGRDRDRDGEHIVEDQGAAGHETQIRPDELGGHAVAAAPGREQLDHLVVGERDDEHRDGGGDGHVQAEVRMRAERAKGFFRTV